MRIAFVVNNYPPRSGGVEFHVAALARHLTGRGHEVTVVTLAERPSVTTEDGIHVIRLRERLRIGDVLGFPPPGTARRLRQMFRARGIELVSVHTRFFPLTWLGVDAARATGIPVILTEHGSDHVSSDSRLISSAARGVDQTLGRRALKRADQVLAVS
ncbi:MAG: glycosyltransferase family 4 protein, partial [bacterium]|nr:glycosyltransferase family 4 protein [bacterium]